MAQTNLPTEGTEFWLGYTNNFTGTEVLEVYITSETTASGQVSMPGMAWSQFFSVTPGVTTNVYIPIGNAQITSNQLIENRAVHVVADNPISVFALNAHFSSMDATVVLPVQSLGTDYFVASYSGVDAGVQVMKSDMLIVGTQDNTEITITPSCITEGGNPQNVPFNIVLNEGQTYRIKGLNALDDLTGTRVKATDASGACRPFAVFSGSECANIPSDCNYCDYLVEQDFPVSSWGSQFLLMPFGTEEYGYRILASQNGTQISIDGAAPIILNEGHYQEFLHQYAAHQVTASAPICVVQYIQGFECTGFSDPSMLVLNDVTGLMQDVTISTPDADIIENNAINIIVNASDVATLYLDGALINPTSFTPFSMNTSFAFVTVPITTGSHVLHSSGQGFSAYVFGYSSGLMTNSYAYSLGSIRAPDPLEVEASFCSSAQVDITISNAYNSVEWFNYNDTTTPIASGNVLSVIPPISNAMYLANATDAISGCPESFLYSVESPNPIGVSITQSDDQICQYENVQLNTQTSVTSANYIYSWNPVIGLSDPNIANPIASPASSYDYTVTVTTPTGCSSSTSTIHIDVLPGNISHFHVSEDTQICAGEPATMNVEAEKIIFFDDFHIGISWALWQEMNNGDANTTCGAVADNALYFTGSGTRKCTTNPMDVTAGGTLYFSVKIANGAAPCDDAEAGDNVVLYYKTPSSGWTPIQTLYENAYPNFVDMIVPIPAGAISSATQFRWQQQGFWSGNQDNWCLDNIYVGVNATSTLNIDWVPSASISNPHAPVVSATPSIPTMYYVTVSDGINGCSYTDSVLVDVGPQFTLDVTNDTTMCDVAGIQLEAVPSVAGDYSYVWSPNDSSVSSIYSADPFVTPAASTLYHVDVTSSYGCQGQGDVQVDIVTLLDIQLLASDEDLCEGDPLILTAVMNPATPDMTYEWTSDHGLSTSGTNATLNETPAVNTIYTVVAHHQPSGCSLTENVEVDVTPTFTVSATPNSITACESAGHALDAVSTHGGPVDWSWTPASAVVDATLASTTVSQNQDVTITVTATTPNGCSASDQVVIDVYSEITELGSNIDACAGDVVELNSGWPANYTINWSTGEHTPDIQLVTSEEIAIEVISPNGCFSSDNVSVVFHDYPIVELGPDIEVCKGELVTLDAGNPSLNVEWLPLFQIANTVQVNGTDMYTAIVDNGFCESRDSVFLNVHPLPLKPFGRDSLVCFEDLGGVVLRAKNEGSTWVWQDGEEGPTYFATEPGNYQVVITTEFACVDSFAIGITESCVGELYVPSAFTPDGDGLNEVWLVTGSDVLEYHLIIYDRWGELIYETNSLKLPWLGQHRDGTKYVEAGVYPYIINYKVKSSTGKISDEKKYKGFVTLIR